MEESSVQYLQALGKCRLLDPHSSYSMKSTQALGSWDTPTHRLCKMFYGCEESCRLSPRSQVETMNVFTVPSLSEGDMNAGV